MAGKRMSRIEQLEDIVMKILLAVIFVMVNALCLAADREALLEVAAGKHRTVEFVARDRYRHPVDTLTFFGLAPDMTVVEIWPGGGWYSELLAPYLKLGTFYAAHFPSGAIPYYDKLLAGYKRKLATDPKVYSGVKLTTFDPQNGVLDVPENSADRVLTFRNVHNWLRSDSEQAAFQLFYRALKPGGILGVVEHRAKPGTSREAMRESGYMTEAYVVELAEQAGFVLDESSEINANPRDTADHPKGVWTLPPSLRLQDQDREKYQAIGESDRMTLRFKKPR